MGLELETNANATCPPHTGDVSAVIAHLEVDLTRARRAAARSRAGAQIVREALRLASERPSLSEIGEALLAFMAQVLDVDSAAVLEHLPDAHSFEVRACTGYATDYMSSVAAPCEPPQFSFANSDTPLDEMGQGIARASRACGYLWAFDPRSGYALLLARHHEDRRAMQSFEPEDEETVANALSVYVSARRTLRAEEDLRRERDLARRLLDTTPVLIALIDVHGRIVNINRYAEQISGYAGHELEGKDWTEHVCLKQERAAMREGFKEALAGRAMPGAIGRIVTKSGDVRDIEWHTATLNSEEGQPSGLLAVGLDVTERLKAEGALRQSEEGYRTTIDAMGDIIHVIDREFRLVVANSTFRSLLEKQDAPDAILGQDLFGTMPFLPLSRREEYERIMQTGESTLTEEHLGFENADLWHEVCKLPVMRDGRCERVVTIIRDITARKMAEKSILRRAAIENLVATISAGFINVPASNINAAIDDALAQIGQAIGVDRCCIFRFSEDGTTISNTHEWCAQGIPRARDDRQSIPSDAVPWWMDKLHSFERIHIPRVSDLPASAGSEKEFLQARGIQSLLSVPLVYANSLVGFMGFEAVREARTWPEHEIMSLRMTGETIVSAVERARVEQALRSVTAAVDQASDAIGITDNTGRPVYVNEALTKLSGYDLASAGRQVVTEGIYDDPATAQAMLDTARAGETWTGEVGLNRLDGSSAPTYVRVDGIRDDADSIVAMLFVHTDIKQLERADQAQRLASIGQLAAGVAHEFNNILGIMSGRAQLAQMKNNPEANAKLATAVLRGSARGADICKSLTSFARPSAPQREPVSVEQPISAALAMATRELQNAGVCVSRESRTAGRHIYADAGQMEQVFLNLIINACHAMPTGGELGIATEYVPAAATSGHITVTVADTGVGIPAEDLPHIFDPFFTTKGRLGDSDVPGTGLGLSVSHGILKAHRATVQAHSTPGAGATFVLRFEAHGVPDATEQESDQMNSEHIAQTAGAVLVADDEEDIRDIVCDTLQANGYDTLSAATTDEALKLLSDTPVSLVICDLMMPGGGGRQVLASVASLPQPPPVIVVTGRSEEHIARELIELGATMYVAKPFGLAELVTAAQEAMGHEDPDAM